jgi:hypothetical protein
MERKEILERLFMKIESDYQQMEAGWRRQTKGELFYKAWEIVATNLAYNQLIRDAGYSDQDLEYLLRFENPLEVTRDKVIEEFFRPDVSEEMKHILMTLRTTGDAERAYALDTEYVPEQGQTIGGME